MKARSIGIVDLSDFTVSAKSSAFQLLIIIILLLSTELVYSQDRIDSFSKLNSFLENNPYIDSPTSLLKHLPESMRSVYSLAYDSGTVASDAKLVSKTNPRIILRGGREFELMYKSSPSNTGDLILAFTIGSKSVEVIEFDGKIFKPYKLDFRNTGLTQRQTGGRAFTLGSIKGCYGCHERKKGRNKRKLSERVSELFFRPNWEGYPVWKGFMGGIHSVFGSPETNNGGETIVQEFIDSVSKDAQSPFRNLINWETISDRMMGEHNTLLTYALGEANGSRLYHAASSIPRSAEFFQLLSESSDWYDRKREFVFTQEHVSTLSRMTGLDNEYLADQLNRELENSRKSYLEYFRNQELQVFRDLQVPETSSFRVERGESIMPVSVFMKVAWEYLAPADLKGLSESWTMSFYGKEGVLNFDTGTVGPFQRSLKLYKDQASIRSRAGDGCGVLQKNVNSILH